MTNFTLTDEQEKEMRDWIKEHKKETSCQCNQKREWLAEKGVVPCGGHGQFYIKIYRGTMADIAYIACECGKKHYLGEV